VSLRLVASFDDQHFALRYQYNQEGKLIRKQAETARGLKTLQETHYHSPNTDQVNN
jgi:YD repeat-containing protein